MATSKALQKELNGIDKEMAKLREKKAKVARQIEEASAREEIEEGNKRRVDAATQTAGPEGVASKEAVS
jgi:hypothetical protein